jgi:hypothetical protein
LATPKITTFFPCMLSIRLTSPGVKPLRISGTAPEWESLRHHLDNVRSSLSEICSL